MEIQIAQMILPTHERQAAIKKAVALIEDPRTRILFHHPNGTVIQDHLGNTLTITEWLVAFTLKVAQ